MLLMLVQSPVYAANAGDKDVAAKQQDKASKSKKVCKRIKVVGSHMKKRICHSQGDWDQMRKEAQESMRRTTNTTPGGSDS